MTGAGRDSRKGQALVEFALILPLFLLLLIGMVEFGRAWMTRNIITGAAREAVRVASVGPPSGGVGPATARANAILDSANLTAARTVTVNDDGVAFGTVSVVVTYQFPVYVTKIVPGLSGDIPLTSTTTMRKEF
jgi:Flp pilus assembly protein TadG